MRRMRNHGEEQKQIDEAIGSDLNSSICVPCFGEISDQSSKNKNNVIGERYEPFFQKQPLGSCVVGLSSGDNTEASNGEA